MTSTRYNVKLRPKVKSSGIFKDRTGGQDLRLTPAEIVKGFMNSDMEEKKKIIEKISPNQKALSYILINAPEGVLDENTVKLCKKYLNDPDELLKVAMVCSNLERWAFKKLKKVHNNAVQQENRSVKEKIERGLLNLLNSDISEKSKKSAVKFIPDSALILFAIRQVEGTQMITIPANPFIADELGLRIKNGNLSMEEFAEDSWDRLKIGVCQFILTYYSEDPKYRRNAAEYLADFPESFEKNEYYLLLIVENLRKGTEKRKEMLGKIKNLHILAEMGSKMILGRYSLDEKMIIAEKLKGMLEKDLSIKITNMTTCEFIALYCRGGVAQRAFGIINDAETIKFISEHALDSQIRANAKERYKKIEKANESDNKTEGLSNFEFGLLKILTM
ncbi:MAG: hypothetical protein WC501_01685 [Candidatus Micrarchaeia archaeon]